MIRSITFVGTRGEASLTIIPAGPSGPSGASAYGVAVANGFVGSDLEWLASLEGDRGKSAYEVAVANGFVGNEAAWLASLNGTDGDDGTNGWTPVHAIVADGERRVKQVVDWIGGTGTKPATGKYVGATGLVDDIGDATDERGAKGADGLGTGDMTKAVYDPQEIEADAFDRANHTGTQAAATITGLATVALTNQYADLAGKPPLGSAADKDATYFAPASHTHPVAQLSDASASGRSLIGAASYAAMRTLLGLVIGTDVQAYDADTAKLDVAQTWAAAQLFGQIGTSVLDLSSGTAINCAANNAFSKAVAGNVTFTITNVPASRSFGIVLLLAYTSGTVTWPASIKWRNNTAPTLTAGKTYVVVLHTANGGTTWRGAASEHDG